MQPETWKVSRFFSESRKSKVGSRRGFPIWAKVESRQSTAKIARVEKSKSIFFAVGRESKVEVDFFFDVSRESKVKVDFFAPTAESRKSKSIFVALTESRNWKTVFPRVKTSGSSGSCRVASGCAQTLLWFPYLRAWFALMQGAILCVCVCVYIVAHR